MEEKDNTYNYVPESLEGKTLDELWIMAHGEEDLEKRKELHKKRMLESDYGEGECNITYCPSCGNKDVPNEDIDFPLEIVSNKIRSIRVRGAKCSDCGEEYINIREVKVIEEIIKLLDKLSP